MDDIAVSQPLSELGNFVALLGSSLARCGQALDTNTHWRHSPLRLLRQCVPGMDLGQLLDASEVLQPAPRDSRKYEEAYVRRLAKELGWTIDTGRRAGVRKPR
jgi:hypothetical protein